MELDEHYGVPLDFIALLHENAPLANTLLQAPQNMLEVLEDALIAAQAGCCAWHSMQKPSAVASFSTARCGMQIMQQAQRSQHSCSCYQATCMLPAHYRQ